MIVTEKKPEREIIEALKGYESIFIIGCGSCADASRTGGEEECMAWAGLIEKTGRKKPSYFVPEETCHVFHLKSLIRQSEQASNADAFLVLACGAGIQSVAAAIDKPAVAGLNTVFLGTTYRAGEFLKYCSMCGNCVLSRTGGICPVTRCPKGLLNGPCSGMVDGVCDVDISMRCVWVDIYEALKVQHKEGMLLEINKPRPYVHSKYKKVQPKSGLRKSI
ncbi:MAG: methylenetetrahydrofolate reductase C-terminal domain-containing protein [Deltaproteobacteria bacterium]|nr:methylenetetrahydrofolate reductase C-terminal domain-containing protein [Deltaproteobacteria bacterium]MCL5792318.1 methylenetetrahydrofolate reductase C-terminal domain-containing protein [Deltaproteobacteria bacterium]